MMRVITGTAGGRRLQTLPGEEITRPTPESVKEALFSMIQFEIEDKRVLDLFAGCGQLGIEALSRGARICTFVENSKAAMQVVEGNISHCGFENNSQTVFCDAIGFLSRKGVYDIAFLDPPYHKGLVIAALPKLAPLMSEDGIIACETARDEELPEEFGDFKTYRSRNYGKVKITLYRKDSDF